MPVLFQLKDSPHTSSGLDLFNIYLIADRAFWLVYPKAHEGPFYYLFLNSKWNGNAAGIAVFGLLPALLLFTKKGYAWVKWLAAVFCVLYLTPLNGVFLLFTNLYYTRWAYAFTLTIIVCTLYYIKDFGLPGMKYAVWYCLVVVTDEFTDTVPGRPVSVDGIFRSFESDHYIPMGFAYDQYVLADSIERLAEQDNTPDIPKILLSSLSIDRKDEEELRPFLRKGVINPSANLDSLVAARRSAICDSFSGHTRGFDAHISLDSAMVVFFSVVADNGFKAYVDGRPTKIYETNLGFSSIVVPAGRHHISFSFFPAGLLSGIVLSVIGLSVLTAMFFKKL